MRPERWQPPVELSAEEAGIVARIKRAKLFVWLREWRHELFSDAFQAELATYYKASAEGQPPVPPAQLALALVLQAYTGVSDDEVIEATLMDRRWQLALDGLDPTEAPFSKGTLVGFRQRLLAQEGERRLIERTVELATERSGFGSRALRAALDSSPLWGAGRVEDTFNLVGHALRKALRVIARQQGQGLAEVAAAAGVDALAASSLKAALDQAWDDPAARTQALQRVLDLLERVEQGLDPAARPAALPAPAAEQVSASLAVAHQVVAQDVVGGGATPRTLRDGVAKDRRISVEDADMRHGRKSRAQRVDGYKRHVLHDLDRGLIRAVGLTPAKAPEATVTEALARDLAHQPVTLHERHLDRAYLTGHWVRTRPADLHIYGKAWPVRNAHGFLKTEFTLDWAAGTLRCPDQVVVPFTVGQTVHFPAETCAVCPRRERCTRSPHGRSVTIHPDERLLQELRERQATAAGRAQLRQRVAVEHTLAHVGHWQGERARYRGLRKNLFDLRRCAIVHNLHVLARLALDPVAA